MEEPELETDRLLLRKARPEDFDRFWGMVTDPIAKRYTGGVTNLTYGERKALFEKECASPFSDQAAEFAVTEKRSGKYLGYCGFRVSKELGGNEFLYGYCRDSWGRGYGTEAAEAVLRYLFKTLPYDSYVAGVNAQNVASVKIVEKLGFRKYRQVTDEDETYDLYEIERRP